MGQLTGISIFLRVPGNEKPIARETTRLTTASTRQVSLATRDATDVTSDIGLNSYAGITFP